MHFIYLIVLISKISFCFGIASLVVPEYFSGAQAVQFVYMCLAGLFLYILTEKAGKKGIIAGVILAGLSTLFTRNPELKILLLILTVYLSYNAMEYINKNKNYGTEVESFKINALIILVVLVFSLFIHPIHVIEKAGAIYTGLYMISTIVMLRILRYAEQNGINNKVTVLNLIYGLGIAGLVLLGNAYVRNIILKVYDVAVDFLLKIISVIFIPAFYLFDIIKKMIKPNVNKIHIASGKHHKKVYPEFSKILHKNDYTMYYKAILFILLLIAVYFIVKKLIKSKVKTNKINNDYTEQKEFIYSEKRYKRAAKNKVNKNEIRKLYTKYLKLCNGKGLELKKSDTSLDVKKKSERHFNDELILGIRNIYIRVRYGGQEPDKETIKEFKNMYDRLK